MNIIDTSMLDEIIDIIKNHTVEELRQDMKSGWSDYADAMNSGYCHSCNGLENHCFRNLPCQWHDLAEKELKRRGIVVE